MYTFICTWCLSVTGSPLIGRKKWSRRKPPYEKFALWEELKNSISTLKLEAEDHNFNSNSAVYCINKKLEVIFLKNHWYILLLNWILFFKNRTIERTYSPMRGISIFQKPHYREFRTMRGRPMRGLPVMIFWMPHWDFWIQNVHFF